MSCQCSSGCPDAVPTINRTEVTNSAYPDVELSIAQIVAGREWKVMAQVSEDIDIPWLVRFHFVDDPDVLNVEVINVPEVPGVSQFFKVTDENGYVEFSVTNSTSGAWYLCAAVVGRVATSEHIIFS